ncbi:GDYXXLXY domain-containing protein [Bordetella muralis]|uniref:GDYXXLXY domain-containing protein n=1 Tax=Bordetella muralis TaxID=1649130 RepID=UPI0039EFC329
MQVKPEIKVGSELHAWRQFLSRGTLWLGIWLLGSAVICGVAANWEALSKTQRFAGAQVLLAVCVVAAAWLGWRLRAADGARRYGPDALLALAGLLLGALLALLGQTYQTGADTWELFAWWGMLLLPWALVAMSQAVWLLWLVVVNIAMVLYVQEGSMFLWILAPAQQMVAVAVVNLLFLAGWEAASWRWRASTVLGPRVLVAWILSLLGIAMFFDYAPLYGLGSSAGLLWILTTLGLGYYYQHVRRDLVILALLAAGVIGMSLRVVGELLVEIANDFWAALPLAALLIGEAVMAAGWLRRLAARPAPVWPPSGAAVDDAVLQGQAATTASHSHGVSAGDTGQTARASQLEAAGHDARVLADDARATSARVQPAGMPHQANPPWYVQGLLALSAWLATLLLLLFVVASELIDSGTGAKIAGVVLCALAVGGLRVPAGLFWRQCLTAVGFAGQLLVFFGLLYPDSSSYFDSGTWFYVLVLGVVVYALGAETLLRFLSAGMMAMALAGLIVQYLVPGFMQADGMWEWLDYEAIGATRVWLPVAVAGAWTAAIAFFLSYAPALGLFRGQPGTLPGPVDSKGEASVGDVVPGGDPVAFDAPVHARFEALKPLAWAFALAVQTMVWLAGGVSLMRWPALWRADAFVALIMVLGVLLPVACAWAVLWPRRRVLTSGVVWGVPLGLLALALFWLPSPGVAFALAWMLLGFGLREPRLTMVGGLSLLVYLLVYYYQLEIPLLDKAFWLGGAALLLFVLRALVYLVPRWMKTIELPEVTLPAPVTSALRWRTAVVLGGLILVLAVVNHTIWQRETLLTQGRVVVLQLAPVDPRSLMQGDYMALNFAVGDQLRPSFDPDGVAKRPTDGYVVLVPDGDGVAQRVRTQADAQPVAGNEIALRYRIRDRDVRIVTNAYFFPEGQADRYARARYGEIRVGDDGTGLLVRMLGEDRQPL